MTNIRCGFHGKTVTHHATIADVRACATAYYSKAPATPVVAVPAPVPATEPGMYVVDGTFYKITISKAGHPYAEELIITGTYSDGASKYGFAYKAGMVKYITTAHKATAEQAAQFGLMSKSCCACHRRLTHTASKAVGYGPVCAAHNGWPHSYTAPVPA